MEKSLFFNSGQFYSAEDWALYFSSMVSTGVNISESLDSLLIAKSSGMNIKVSPGKAIIKGYYYELNGNGLELAIAQTTAQQRIDRIILRLNLNQNEWSIKASIKQGTVSAPPALQRDTSIHELSLASVTIPPNSNNLNNATISDERTNAAVCGIMSFLGNQQFQQPAGSIIWYPTPTAPLGYLYCNGAAISRAEYNALFSVIGVMYGSGNGSTTFNIPDLRGLFFRGFDGGRGYDPARTFATEQQSTRLSMVDKGTTKRANKYVSGGENLSEKYSGNGSSGGTQLVVPDQIDFDVRPINIALLPCIKT